MARQLPPSPKAISPNTSKAMKANKAQGTKPELALRKFLMQHGGRGYRLNWKRVPGRPDLCYPGKKLAIFVHGCFWHRCPICTSVIPKTNTAFWKRKFELNIIRDLAKKDALEALGWNVLTVWECEIKKNDLAHVLNFLN
jgi:DNA mismatch endonuclease (patch repair protein)